VFVNNAGSLGPLTAIGTQNDNLSQYTSEFAFNVTSSCYLTSEITRRFKAALLGSASKIVVVNISSLAAIQPFEVLIIRYLLLGQ
jgi:NAD(P)-dependent dehydrogenase (short-subunit alcohol dehydrogenase family)